MFSERRITDLDRSPQMLHIIARRFGFDADGKKRTDRAEDRAIKSTPIGHGFMFLSSEPFVQAVEPFEPKSRFRKNVPVCPFFLQINLAALFVGLRDPDNHEQMDARLTKLYCGHRLTEERSLGIFGPMSGREGTEYSPFSQCWRVTIELAQLLEFMEQEEELPLIQSASNEAELREILNQREKISKHNAWRQEIYAHWLELLANVPLNNYPAIKAPIDYEIEVKHQSKPEVLDGTAQFRLWSQEYKTVMEWIKYNLSLPLIQLVGQRNTAMYLNPDQKSYVPPEGETAENCAHKPIGWFDGFMT